jgi:hypothetical protein
MVIGCFQMLQDAEEIRVFYRNRPIPLRQRERRGFPRRRDLIASVRRH